MDERLKRILDRIPKVRRDFEMQVGTVALEVIDIAKQISPAIGNVSVTEAKMAIIKEFTERLMR